MLISVAKKTEICVCVYASVYKAPRGFLKPLLYGGFVKSLKAPRVLMKLTLYWGLCKAPRGFERSLPISVDKKTLKFVWVCTKP